MRIPVNEVQESRSDIDAFGYNDYNRTAPLERNRPSPFSISTSPSYLPPLSPVKRSSWKRLSFGKFSSQPIRLSILKLDGSSFDIFVTKKASVRKVKKAVESAFNHMPIQEGDGKISWSHVWDQFCLSFEHMKLLRDRDSITRFGIQNGDQLQFVRHTPIYRVAGEGSEKLPYYSIDPEGSISKWDEGYEDFDDNTKSYRMKGSSSHRRHEGAGKGNVRVIHSKARLGRPLPRDDANNDGNTNLQSRLSSKSSRYRYCKEFSIFSGYTGGFGGFTYPTGYCMK